MRSLGIRLVIVLLFCLFFSITASTKSSSDYIADLQSSNQQVKAASAKQILNHPHDFPLIALERAILIAGEQRLQETKQALINILQDTSYRGMTRGLAANSLGYIAQGMPSGANRNDIYSILISATYDKLWDVRLAACRALGNTGNRDAVTRLSEIYSTDSDPRVQLYAGKAYLELTGIPSSQQIRTASTSTSPPGAVTQENILQRILDYINKYIKVL